MSIISSPWIVLALIGVIVVFILFSLFKGVIKLLLFLVAAVSAIASWIFLQKNGFTFLSFVTNNPQPWMVGGGFLCFRSLLPWYELVFAAFLMASRRSFDGRYPHDHPHVLSSLLGGNGRCLLL